MIPYEWIDSMTYERKNDNLLTIQYKRRDKGQFARFQLNGGNRDQILASLEADSGVKVSRISN